MGAKHTQGNWTQLALAIAVPPYRMSQAAIPSVNLVCGLLTADC